MTIESRYHELVASLPEDLSTTESNTCWEYLRTQFRLSGGDHIGDCRRHIEVAFQIAKDLGLAPEILQGYGYDVNTKALVDTTFGLVLNGSPKLFLTTSPSSLVYLGSKLRINLCDDVKEMSHLVNELPMLFKWFMHERLSEAIPAYCYVLFQGSTLLCSSVDDRVYIYHPKPSLPAPDTDKFGIEWTVTGETPTRALLEVDTSVSPTSFRISSSNEDAVTGVLSFDPVTQRYSTTLPDCALGFPPLHEELPSDFPREVYLERLPVEVSLVLLQKNIMSTPNSWKQLVPHLWNDFLKAITP